MASTPLFIVDRDTLLAELRLSNVPSTNGAQGVIDAAIRAARAAVYRHLGASLITSLLSTAYSATPSDEAGYLRLTANELEATIVRLELVERLPVGFLDGDADRGEEWDSAAPWHDVNSESQKRISALKTSIRTQIAEMVAQLKGSIEAGDATTLQVKTFGSPDAPRAPGSLIGIVGL